MQDPKLTPDMVPVIKLARQLGIPYTWISHYFGGLNFGRIRDAVKSKRYKHIPCADTLPPDFPQPA